MAQNYEFPSNYRIQHSLDYSNLYYCPLIMFIPPFLPLNPYDPALSSLNPPPLLHLANQLTPQFLKANSKDQRAEIRQKQQYNVCFREEQKIQQLKIQNRNILPNNLNLILSYIRRINKSGSVVGRVLKRLNKGDKYSVKKFYSYQAYLKEQIPFHKTKLTIKQITQHSDSNFNIFTRQQQMFYNKICRIVILDFLRNQYLPTLLTSTKIHKTSKKDHLKVRRYLHNQIETISKQNIEDGEL